MSWLLVALIPGLLMLATFGLDRLEAGLARERTPARGVQRRPQPPPAVVQTLPADLDSDRLPTLRYVEHTINPEFRATRHANRV
ncbi:MULTISPECIES: hypothetical protein [Mycolicibacterium]|uniref:Uncharacterized protein n=1 Tax=Mycolicibacterium wolinskyi TaxID=59750 RepID=A0A132PLP8_9MYCO|nr:hypothetical protein AFM11_15760 [Mycolicibacterium wolinskyi]ORX17916.1 hypothetical protein AWC31_16005 [Mycolicibacterium wolinskyi]